MMIVVLMHSGCAYDASIAPTIILMMMAQIWHPIDALTGPKG